MGLPTTGQEGSANTRQEGSGGEVATNHTAICVGAARVAERWRVNGGFGPGLEFTGLKEGHVPPGPHFELRFSYKPGLDTWKWKKRIRAVTRTVSGCKVQVVQSGLNVHEIFINIFVILQTDVVCTHSKLQLVLLWTTGVLLFNFTCVPGSFVIVEFETKNHSTHLL